MRRPKLGFVRTLVLGSVLFLGGCDESTLLTGLDQRDANEIYVALEQAGIPVQIVVIGKGEEQVSTIVVPGKDEARARLILADHELPRGQEYETLLGMLKETNLLSTEEENREIFRRTREWELAQKIEDLPSVIRASVSLTLPRVDPLQLLAGGTGVPRPTASVAVRYWRPGSSNNPGDVLRPAVIQNLISGGVEKMLPEDVKVTLTAVSPHEPVVPAKADMTGFFAMYAIVIVALLVVLLLLFARYRALSRHVAALEAEAESSGTPADATPGAGGAAVSGASGSAAPGAGGPAGLPV